MIVLYYKHKYIKSSSNLFKFYSISSPIATQVTKVFQDLKKKHSWPKEIAWYISIYKLYKHHYTLHGMISCYLRMWFIEKESQPIQKSKVISVDFLSLSCAIFFGRFMSLVIFVFCPTNEYLKYLQSVGKLRHNLGKYWKSLTIDPLTHLSPFYGR